MRRGAPSGRFLWTYPKETLHGFLWQKKLPPPPDIPVTIDKKPFTKVKEKRVLGVIINENLSFTSHMEQITKKCKTVYNRLTLHPDLLPHQALQLHKAYIRNTLEYGCIIWGHTIYQKNHMKQLKDAQRGTLSLILRNPQQWKNNDDLNRWISFGKSRANRFRCSYQKEWSRKHRNQNCTCNHKNGHQLSRRTTSNKNRNNICQRKHQHLLTAKQQFKPS